ncbi:MAG: hypothetical protein LBB19_03570 [Puniceicoccales bacterium]|jgi:hypothetical protein|nr:hypothetical protein [Puniceicoccales bacterium]
MSISNSVTGLPSAEVQAAASVTYPDLPTIGKACVALSELIVKLIPPIVPKAISDVASKALKLLIEKDILHLKERIFNAIVKGHTNASEIFKKFGEANGAVEFFKALGNMFHWATGKELYGLALACTKILGWLVIINQVVLKNATIQEWLTNLKQDFETIVTFKVGQTAVILSAEQRQTNEHRVSVTEDTGTISQPTASLAEKSDATHDVKTREQRILETIQQLLLPNADIEQLLADNGIRNVIQQLDTEADMVTYLLSLLNLTSVPERLLAIIANSRGPQSA